MAMTLDEVHPDLRDATARMQAMRMPPRFVIRAAGRVMPVPRLHGATVRAVRADGLRLRVYRPAVRRSAAALLWIHGGGLVIGDARQDEPLCGSTAARLGITIVSANYRLAPQHPFPAALDDVRAAWAWTRRHAGKLDLDPDRIAVGGESAGAGLAAALTQRLLDEGGAQPTAQWLFAPMLDDRTAADRSLDDRAHLVWSNTANRDGWSSYLGHDAGAAEPPPYAVPARRGDLAGLPPAYLTWGDIELFAAEDAAYADRLRESGVAVTVDVVPGAPHGFENWARTTPIARTTIERAQDWLETRIA